MVLFLSIGYKNAISHQKYLWHDR